MSLAGKLIAFVGKRAAKRFDKACENPGKVQTDLLLDMVRRNPAPNTASVMTSPLSVPLLTSSATCR